MARRRRPREWQTRTAATLLGLAFSRSAAEALLTSSSNAFAKNTHPSAAAVQQHYCSLPAGSGHNRIALSAAPPGGRHGARVWRLGPARTGTTEDDDEGADAAAVTARNTRLVQAAAAVRMAATADKAMSATPAEADQGQHQRGRDQGEEEGKKRAVLRRVRRRAKAKIKAIPARILDSSSPGGRRRRSKKTSGKKRPQRARLFSFGRRSSESGGVAGVADGGGEDRGGRGRQRRSWGVGAVGSAVFGTPARFVRRKVDACKSFVTSRDRVHWASLAMAVYIFATSVAPRVPAGM